MNDWKPIADFKEEQIRIIGAIDDHVIGDIYFGSGPLVVGEYRMGGEEYAKQRMIKKWRYTDSSRPVPEHLQPKWFIPLPNTPKNTN